MTEPNTFLHRLIENAYSWAMQNCNYLDPGYMDQLIERTKSGMKPEEAAIWRADRVWPKRLEEMRARTLGGDVHVGVDLAKANDQYAVFVYSPAVLGAAKAWRAARLAVVNLSIADPAYRQRLNDLAEAEDALSRAVEEQERPMTFEVEGKQP